MKDFKYRVAVITGAASGIGRGLSEQFIEAGMKVVLADIDESNLQTTVNNFKDSGADVIGVHTDVSKPDQVKALAAKTMDTFGAVHVLCNNAGVGYGGRNSWGTPTEAWNWVLNVNLMGVIHGIQTFLPIMLEQNTEAHVVNTASVAGLIMNRYNVVYGVSKYAVVALSESLHLELLNVDAKVKVSVLCPGPVSTDIMNSSQRLRPDNVPPPPDPTPEEDLLLKAYEIYIERGMAPKDVAKQVFDAIQNERFYVITHDFNNYIELRLKNILNTKNPEPPEIPQEFLDIMQEMMNQ